MAKRPFADLVVAVPKGRVLKALAARFERAGVSPKQLLSDDRRLVRVDPTTGMTFLLVKPDDVPTYVEYGAADLGIAGRDVLLEREYDLYAPLDLGVGVCRMVVAGPAEARPVREPLRVATKYPQVASRHFLAQGLNVELIYVQGSVELAPITGLAEVIVDLVESGETLRQNGLVVKEHVADVSSVVVVNRARMKLKHAAISAFLNALR